MKIKDLIAILEKHHNQDAEINFISNVVNSDDDEHDFDCSAEVISADAFYDNFVEIYIIPKKPLGDFISMPVPQKDRGNFINSDKTISISSYGDVFQVGEEVGHESNDVETAIIESFGIDEPNNEVYAQTNLGTAHIDFLVKLNK